MDMIMQASEPGGKDLERKRPGRLRDHGDFI